MNVAELFAQVANQMRAEVEQARAAIAHAGLKGGEFEKILKTFLRRHLPSSLDISAGQLVDSKGGVSKQLDVIISDTAKTPILYQNGDVRVVPAECVYSVVEVKAHLGVSDLDGVFENMQSVKGFQKTAYQNEIDIIDRRVNMYGHKWSIWPINYFVFAYDGADLDAIRQRLDILHTANASPVHSRIDLVCVLDRGVICNRDPNGMVSGLPSPTTHLAAFNTTKSLLLFYVLCSEFLNQAFLPTFRIVDYVRKINFD